jgi:hypothetical protein
MYFTVVVLCEKHVSNNGILPHAHVSFNGIIVDERAVASTQHTTLVVCCEMSFNLAGKLGIRRIIPPLFLTDDH